MSAEQVEQEKVLEFNLAELTELDPNECLTATAYKSDHFRSFNIVETRNSTWIEISSIGTLPDGTEQISEYGSSDDEGLRRTRQSIFDAVRVVSTFHNSSLPKPQESHPSGDWMPPTKEHQVATGATLIEIEKRKVSKFADALTDLNQQAELGNFGVKLVCTSEDRPPVIASLRGFAIEQGEVEGGPINPIIIIASESGDKIGRVPSDYRIAKAYAEKVA